MDLNVKRVPEIREIEIDRGRRRNDDVKRRHTEENRRKAKLDYEAISRRLGMI